MCGIAGALDLTGSREFSRVRLLAMMKAIAHRGPDDEQLHVEPGVAVGSRRLAIMDIAHGRQPVSNRCGDVWAAFNGEIFNYPDLRKKLFDRGHQLHTHCDTEVWPYLYDDHSEGMFEEVQGQFAVSLWDHAKRTLILGRDRMGICPLYYTVQNGWLLWGSEIKSLLASGLVLAQPDIKGIDHLFNFFCAGSSRTFFEGIHLLPPGHYLKVKDSHLQLKPYWDLDFPNAGEERRLADPSALVDELEMLLTRAVERRLQSDVPVVNYISGGLDSTVALGMTQRVSGRANRSFTIGMDRGAGPDERASSAESARLLGSELTTLALKPEDIVNAFPELIVAAEGPVLDTSCAALLLLAKEVNKQGYKVVLTGEGADEALAGYFWFKTQKMSGKVNQLIGPALSNLLRRLLHYSIARGRSRDRVTPWAGVRGVRPAQQFMYESVGLARNILYSDDMWANLRDHDPYSDLHLPNDRMQHWDPLNQSLYVGYKVMLSGLLMISKGDRIGMNSSVEMRYPFLDEDVVNFCASIAPEYKLRGVTDKWLLRQVAAKTLPTRIANRPKTMFRASLFKIFNDKKQPTWIGQLLSEESLKKTGYFDHKVVARERQLHALMPNMTPRQHIMDSTLTCVLSTQLWYHLFCGGGLCELPVWELPKIG